MSRYVSIPSIWRGIGREFEFLESLRMGINLVRFPPSNHEPDHPLRIIFSRRGLESELGGSISYLVRFPTSTLQCCDDPWIESRTRHFIMIHSYSVGIRTSGKKVNFFDSISNLVSGRPELQIFP